MNHEHPEEVHDPIPLRQSEVDLSMQEVVQLNNDSVKEIASYYQLPITNRAGTNKSVLINYLIRRGWTPSDQIIESQQQTSSQVNAPPLNQPVPPQSIPEDNSVDEIINQIISNNSNNNSNNQPLNNYGPVRGSNIAVDQHRHNPLVEQQVIQDHGNHNATTDQV